MSTGFCKNRFAKKGMYLFLIQIATEKPLLYWNYFWLTDFSVDHSKLYQFGQIMLVLSPACSQVCTDTYEKLLDANIKSFKMHFANTCISLKFQEGIKMLILKTASTREWAPVYYSQHRTYW